MNTIIYANNKKLNKNESNNRNENSNKNSSRNIRRICAVFGLSLLASVCIVFGVHASVPKDFDLNTPSNTIPPGYNKIPGTGGETYEVGGKDIDDSQGGENQNTLPPGHSGSENQNPENMENEYQNYDIETEYECYHESTYTVDQNFKHPTCAAYGSYDKVTYCSDCNDQVDCVTIKLEVSDNAHKALQTIPYSAPTCETPGNNEYYVCNDCGRWFLPDLVEIYSHNDVLIPAKNHSWGEWTVSQQAACTTDGLKTSTCLHDPHHVKTEKIPSGHITHERRETVPATCTEDGGEYAVVFCTVCSEEISRTLVETLKASGHTPVKAVKEYIKEADSVNNGSYDEVVYCEKCKTELERITIIIPAPEKPQQNPPEDSMPLLTTDWTVDAEPTCEQNGLRSRYLNNEKKEEEILALGHNWDEWTVIKSPSYNLPGKKQRVCKHDKTHIEIQSIAALTLNEYLQKIFDDKLSFQYPSTNNTTSIPYGGYNPFESQGSEGNPNAIHNPDASQIQAGNKPGTIKATKESPGLTAKRSDRLNEDILSVRPHKLEISSGEDSIDLLYYLFGEDVELRTIDQYYDYLRFIKGLMLDPYPPRPQNTIMIKVAEMTQEILKKHPTAHSAKYRINIGSENAGTKYTIYHVDSQSDSLISAGTVTASSDGEVAIDATKHDGMMMFLIPDYVSKFESHFYKDSPVPDNFISKPPRLPRLGGGRMFIPNIC